jgi:hypothetical protein
MRDMEDEQEAFTMKLTQVVRKWQGSVVIWSGDHAFRFDFISTMTSCFLREHAGLLICVFALKF